MIRAGVLTLDGSHNYGNRLQNYAVHRILALQGLSPYSIRFNRLPADVRIKEKLYLALKGKSCLRFENPDRRLMFENFSRLTPYEDFNYSERKELDKYFDLFVIGSDQVWNPAFNGLSGLYFLPWENSTKISLAASFGTASLPRLYRSHYARCLDDIPFLSVREDTGAKIVCELTGRIASVLLDPVFSLDANAWSKVSNDDIVPKHDYIFAYILGALKPDHLQEIRTAANDYGLSLFLLSDRDEDGAISAGPSEFISLIKHAQCVITDSFHASAFSTIFEKPLHLVSRSEVGNTSSRFNAIFGTLGVKRLSLAEALDRVPQYECVRKHIEQQNDLTNAFLEQALKAACIK